MKEISEYEQMEIESNECKKIQAQRDKCLVLMNSKSFQDVIEDGYFRDEAARLVMAKSAELTDMQQKNIDCMILGIGGFHNYLNLILQRGRQADQQLEDLETTREQIAAEELDEESSNG